MPQIFSPLVGEMADRPEGAWLPSHPNPRPASRERGRASIGVGRVPLVFSPLVGEMAGRPEGVAALTLTLTPLAGRGDVPRLGQGECRWFSPPLWGRWPAGQRGAFLARHYIG